MNERRKNEYIEIARFQNEALVLHLKTYFNNVKPFEKEYGKDVCDFVATEIITLYKSFGTSSINYLTVMNSQYSKYTDWCLNEHLVKDNQNHFREIDQDTLASCLNKIRIKAMVVSEEELYRSFNQIQNVSDQFLCLALFEGICGKNASEISNLRLENFDMDKKLVHLETRTVRVSTKLCELAKESAFEYVYYSQKRELHYNLQDQNIIKVMYNVKEPNDNRRRKGIFNRLTKLNEQFGVEYYSISALVESGRINMVKRLMREDGYDLLNCLINHKAEVEEKYGTIPSINRYVIKYSVCYED